MTPRPRLVLLDFGGTLAREEPSRQAIYAQVAEGLGRAIDAERMAALMTRVHRELPREIDGAWRYSERWFRTFIERVFGDLLALDEVSVQSAVDTLFARFGDPRTFRPCPGALQLLADLGRAGVRTGVVSNWSPALQGLLDGLGLAAHLDPVICSAVERVEKPDPAIFRLALRRAGVAAEHALHVGDHPENDVAAARAAGLEALLVDHGGGARPGEAVGSFGELTRLVLAREP